MQGQIAVHVRPRLECPRRRLERHGLVLEHAQVGQYEFRPVLVQVAEEHQAQAFAKIAHHHAPHGLVGRGVPSRIGLGRIVPSPQGLQQVRLARRRLDRGIPKQAAKLGLGMQGEQLVQRHWRVGVQPPQRLQRRRGILRAGDFLIDQPAGAEPRPAPPQHAPHPRLGRLRQGLEVFQETAFAGIQQVGVAVSDPRQRALEIVKLVFYPVIIAGG
ncbi:hypothetical protein G6F31_016563 [Rhizopus arrhizus]|nr:hypothetical protein G6F31_016563 [Rhizopus arrhizus]